MWGFFPTKTCTLLCLNKMRCSFRGLDEKKEKLMKSKLDMYQPAAVLDNCLNHNLNNIFFIFRAYFTFALFISPVLTLRTSVPRVPRHRHHQGDQTTDSLPQHQQNQRGLRLWGPSAGGGDWEWSPPGQPRTVAWSEHPVAGARNSPGKRRAGAADHRAVQVPGGELGGGQGRGREAT